MTASSDDLKGRFLAALRGSTVGWSDLWRLLVEHPWYQTQLHHCAAAVLRRRGAPRDWQDDLEQEAMLLLGSRMSRTPDLRVDRQRAERSFAAWMRAIIISDCRQALRKLDRQQRTTATDERPSNRAPPQLALEERIDVARAVDQLDEPDRTAVLYFSQGRTVPELAAAMNLRYWQAHHVLHRGLALGNSVGQILRQRLTAGQSVAAPLDAGRGNSRLPL